MRRDKLHASQKFPLPTRIMNSTPKETLKPFYFAMERDICKDDRDPVCVIMRLDLRDRPTPQSFLKMSDFGRVCVEINLKLLHRNRNGSVYNLIPTRCRSSSTTSRVRSSEAHTAGDWACHPIGPTPDTA